MKDWVLSGNKRKVILGLFYSIFGKDVDLPGNKEILILGYFISSSFFCYLDLLKSKEDSTYRLFRWVSEMIGGF